jgi:hypothetical protein
VYVSADSTFDGPYGLDTDGDRVPDCAVELICADATADVPEKELGTNRWIFDGGAWITDSPGGTDPQTAFTIWQTKCCGCFQILDWLGTSHPGEYGEKQGYYKHGCTASVIDAFIELSLTPTD